MSEYEEYLVCKKRGHEADPKAGVFSYAIEGSPQFKTCKYCGTTFWTTTEVTEHEKNAPAPPNHITNNR